MWTYACNGLNRCVYGMCMLTSDLKPEQLNRQQFLLFLIMLGLKVYAPAAFNSDQSQPQALPIESACRDLFTNDLRRVITGEHQGNL